jgi:hypothetical protein
MFIVTINEYVIAGNQYGAIAIKGSDKKDIKYFNSLNEGVIFACSNTFKQIDKDYTNTDTDGDNQNNETEKKSKWADFAAKFILVIRRLIKTYLFFSCSKKKNPEI